MSEQTETPSTETSETTADTTTQTTDTTTQTAPASLWEQIPENIRSKPGMERYKAPDAKLEDVFHDLDAKSSMLGKMAQGTWAQLPAEDDIEGRRKVLAQMGVAEDFASYAEAAKLDPKALPEGFEVDPDFDQAFLTLAHQVGVHPSDINKFRGFVAEKATEAAETAAKANEERIAAELKVLEAAWGPANGRTYNAQKAAANEAADRLNYLAHGLDPDKDELPQDAPTIAKVLTEAGLATNPTILRALASLNQVFTGNSTAPVARGGSGAETPADMEARAEALQAESMSFINKDNDKVQRMQAEAFKLRERAALIRKGA